MPLPLTNPAPGQSATCGPRVSEVAGRKIALILAVLALLAGCGSESTTTNVPSGPTFAYVTDASLGTITKIRTSDASIEATIPLSLVNGPQWVKVSPDGTRLYVANQNGISVVDATRWRVVHTIAPPNCEYLECGVSGIDLTADGAFLYVTTEGTSPDLGDDAVIAIETSTYQVVATIPVKPRPDAIAVSPTGFASVVLGQSSAVVVIDTRTNSVTETLHLPGPPGAIAVTHNGRFAYVAREVRGYPNNVLDVIDTSTDTVITEIPVSETVSGIAITPNDTTVYVASPSGTVTAIDAATKTVSATIQAKTPYQVTVAPDGAFAYVSDPGSGGVLIVDTSTNTIVDHIPADSGPYGIAVASNGRALYVVNSLYGVSMIDTVTRTVTSVIHSDTLGSLVVRPDGRFAYVSIIGQYPGGTVALLVMDTMTNSIVARIPFDHTGPLAMSPSGKFLYVGSNPLAVVDTATNTIVHQISLESQNPPEALALAPDGTRAYAVTEGTTNVDQFQCAASILWVIDTLRGTASASTALPGDFPFDIAIAPDGRFAYVAIVPPPPLQWGPCQFDDPPPPWCQCPVFSGVMAVDTTTNTVVASIPEAPPLAVAIHPDGQFAYVTTRSYAVDVIDTSLHQVVTSVAAPSNRVAVTPDGAAVYAVGLTSSVAVIDTATKALAKTIFLGGTPVDVAMGPGAGGSD